MFWRAKLQILGHICTLCRAKKQNIYAPMRRSYCDFHPLAGRWHRGAVYVYFRIEASAGNQTVNQRLAIWAILQPETGRIVA